MEPGQWGIWPCSECGGETEGDWEPGAFCGACAPKVRVRERDELLRVCLPYVPAEVQERIHLALEGKDPSRSQPEKVSRFQRV